MSLQQEALEKFTAVIAVASITPPTGRGQSYCVETVDGNQFWLWKDKVGLMRIGEQYEVEYTEKHAGNAVYRNLQGTPRHLGPYRAPRQQPQPQGQKKMDYWQPKPRDPAEQKQIWVCAMLCREIEMFRTYMSEAELIERGEVHARVWEDLFGVREIAGDERGSGV